MDQGCSNTGGQDAACDGEPRSGHRAQDTARQPGPSTSSTGTSRAAGLDPKPLPPRFTQPQIPTWTPRGHLALIKQHVPHPACAGRREGARWSKPKGSSVHGALRLPQPPPGVSTHPFNHCFPSFNIITRQPASQHQLLQITINGSLFSRLLLNRYRN